MSSTTKKRTDKATPELTGADYVAVKSRLTDADGAELAAIGQTCERVNPDSLPWLLAQGYIEPKPAAAAVPEGKE